MVVSYGIHTIRHTRLTFHIPRTHTHNSQNINKEAYNNNNSKNSNGSSNKLCARNEWEAKEHCSSNNMEYVYSHCQCVKQTRQSSTVEFLSTTNGMGEQIPVLFVFAASRTPGCFCMNAHRCLIKHWYFVLLCMQPFFCCTIGNNFIVIFCHYIFWYKKDIEDDDDVCWIVWK